MLKIERAITTRLHTLIDQEQSQLSVVDRKRRAHHHLILTPLARVDCDDLLRELLMLLLRGLVDKLHYQLGRLAIGHTRPHREAVVGIAL